MRQRATFLKTFSHFINTTGVIMVGSSGSSPFENDPPRISTGVSVIEPESVVGVDGRTFHGYREGKYFLPNDPDEQDRLDFQHAQLMMLQDGKLAFAPLKDPQWAIDVATGTGIWALDFAEQYPQCKVIGTDLSKIQPDPTSMRLNCEFLKEDAEEAWIYDHKFDYVHLRAVVSCFDDHRTVMRHAFDNIKPGGWIEYQDGSCECNIMEGSPVLEGTAFQRWFDLFNRSAMARGRDMLVPNHYKQWLLDAGFVDVVQEIIPWPLTAWPTNPKLKEVGRWNSSTWCGVGGNLAAARNILFSAGLLPQAEIDQLTSEFHAELLDNRNRFFMPWFIVYGRKPFKNEMEISKDTDVFG
jgi:ubiquinone/menaquinone biosynthesis C-methylase UbiE